MITGIRLAILCDQVAYEPDGRAVIEGFWGETILAMTRPGAVSVCLALACDLDARATRAELWLNADDYAWSFPFEPPAGRKAAMYVYNLVLPIKQPGPLTLTIYDEARGAEPLRVNWDIDFHPEAKVLDEAEGRALIAEASRANEALATETYDTIKHGERAKPPERPAPSVEGFAKLGRRESFLSRLADRIRPRG